MPPKENDFPGFQELRWVNIDKKKMSLRTRKADWFAMTFLLFGHFVFLRQPHQYRVSSSSSKRVSLISNKSFPWVMPKRMMASRLFLG